MNQSIHHSHVLRLGPALLVLAFGPGCTSVLTSASLRDLVWDGDGHAAEAAPPPSDADTEGDPDATDLAGGVADEAATDDQRRRAAVEEATERLARLDHLDDAARATLTETLERTQQEDWPAVIDAFAESLAAAGRTAAPVAAGETAGDAERVVADLPGPAEPDAHVVAKADLDAAAADAATGAPEATAAPEPPFLPEPTASPAAENPVAVAAEPPPAAEPGPASSLPAMDAATSAGQSLAIENACFASRVQAWGVLDRFAAARFRPGQEVIVYFELDGLSAGESPAGHTSCIDSELRLVDAAGSLVHAWSFEPIAETCRARRRDYFARYVVRLPETGVAGACRVELQVTDTLSGQVATATLPLEVLPDAGP
jgi:hypothetical protein